MILSIIMGCSVIGHGGKIRDKDQELSGGKKSQQGGISNRSRDGKIFLAEFFLGREREWPLSRQHTFGLEEGFHQVVLT